MVLQTPPPAPAPTWAAADFDCGQEPAAPPQSTTKAVAEAYTVDLHAWGLGCAVKLAARGADAARYSLVSPPK